jgi:hypothetical protein
LRSEFDSRIADTAGQINTLAEEVRILNVHRDRRGWRRDR